MPYPIFFHDLVNDRHQAEEEAKKAAESAAQAADTTEKTDQAAQPETDETEIMDQDEDAPASLAGAKIKGNAY